ncbi:uncharacterized protein EV420DRAFT_1487904 [Desarmillaria tabescens]|uniref:Uncharacterized protein n=1 Tax=Armillaria tabescens TaxID=1929756 RepID=A0AA39MIL6_ARMTA|nr:uncharacterized protein EV420DRAFT_1487904 [Desarmillaria tabescens]KAK0435692.1 hypothetical protein EV420DRAFT_1487904 [Desarmillaria tabescens]
MHKKNSNGSALDSTLLDTNKSESVVTIAHTENDKKDAENKHHLGGNENKAEYQVWGLRVSSLMIGGYRSCEDVECISLNVQFAIHLETQDSKDAQAPFDSFYEDFGDETPLGVDDTHVMERYSGDITDIPVSVLPSGPVIKCAIRYKIPSTQKTPYNPPLSIDDLLNDEMLIKRIETDYITMHQSPPTYAGPDSDPPKTTKLNRDIAT